MDFTWGSIRLGVRGMVNLGTRPVKTTRPLSGKLMHAVPFFFNGLDKEKNEYVCVSVFNIDGLYLYFAKRLICMALGSRFWLFTFVGHLKGKLLASSSGRSVQQLSSGSTRVDTDLC